MQNHIILSIDWDHTFRSFTGLDFQILSVVLYAKSKDIPVGLTTHRDKENTTLYTLYNWDRPEPKDETESLSAAISYWDAKVFTPFNVKFDFINARYQLLYKDSNYYIEELLPLEKQLADEIINYRILHDVAIVKDKIKQYGIKEAPIELNEYKETQTLWLSQQYAESHPQAVIYHIDDSNDVCNELPERFSELQCNPNMTVKTISYKTAPFFSNESCVALLDEIGMLTDIKAVLESSEHLTSMLNNQQRCLSIYLAVLLLGDVNDAVISDINNCLLELEVDLNNKNEALFRYIQTLAHEKLQSPEDVK